MYYKVFIGTRSEEQVQVAACEAQRMAAGFGNQDVVTGRNWTADAEHSALQRLVLPWQEKWGGVKDMIKIRGRDSFWARKK